MSRLIQGLGLSEDILYAEMSTLTAKEKVKVLLAQALFGKPDIILLDEPTNHLDIQAIQWLDSKLVTPLVERLRGAGTDFRLLLLSDHKTLTATRGHDGDPVPYLLYDSTAPTGRGGTYDEAAGERGPFLERGDVLLDLLFDRKTHRQG